MSDFKINQKAIAKNTVFLYTRMVLVLFVNLYAVRELLQILGIEDYGIYTIGMGIIVMFSTLCNAMTRTTQRFLSIAIKNDEANEGKRVYTICFVFFLGASILLVLLAETVGLLLFKRKIQIPDDRIPIALVVYQISIICVVIKTMTIPFSSAIIAKEKMSFFARLGFLEAMQTLAIVFMLRFLQVQDKLIAYSIMIMISLIVLLFCNLFYCRRNFAFCRFTNNIDAGRVKDIFHFSGWSLLGACANLAKTQGINVLINMFHGVNYNTTWGVTTQVAGGVNYFINGFQQAFTPEILKSEANEGKKTFWNLLFTSAKYSYLLFWMICSPILLNQKYILDLWLGKEQCPPQIELFITFAFIFYLCDCLSGPLWTAIEAIGKIKIYQISISCLMFSGVLVSYLLFKFMNMPAYTAMAVNVFFNILCLLYRLAYLRKKRNLDLMRFLKDVFFPIGTVTVLSLLTMFCIKHFILTLSFPIFIVESCLLVAFNILICFTFGLDQKEKRTIVSFVTNKLKMEEK